MKLSSRPKTTGFTLVEMLAVITIIVILAGLVVGGMGFVNERQAREKAKTQIGMLETALEEFKLDHGSYPATTNSSTGTKGNSSIDVFDMSEPSPRRASLYFVLFGKGEEALEGTRDDFPIYLEALNNENNKQGWTVSGSTNILDPWGKPYRYRTAVDPRGRPNRFTQNPDFDLWSSGKDGKTSSDPKNPVNKDDIKNF